MSQHRINKRVNITLPPELNERWNAVAKKYDIKKSAMVREFLELVLPTLEKDSTSSMIESVLMSNAKAIDELKKVAR